MAGKKDSKEQNPIKPSCDDLTGFFNRMSCKVGIGAPTMSNAEPNINHAAADKVRDRVADGTQNLGIASAAGEGLQRTANAVKARQAALDAAM